MATASSSSVPIFPLASILGLSHLSSEDGGSPADQSDDQDSARRYLSELPSHSLKSLVDEPKALRSRSEALQNDLTALTFRHAPALLEAHSAQDHAHTTFTSLESNLDRLFDSLSSIDSLSRSFATSIAPPLAQDRAKLLEARANADAAYEILNLPNLIATCIRADLWSEALELAAKVPKFGSLQQQADRQIDILRARVWETLSRPDLKLPAASRAISTLRRLRTQRYSDDNKNNADKDYALDVEETDQELIWALLMIRWKVFDAMDAEEHGIKHYVDRWRERVGDAISISTQLFPDTSSRPLHAFLSHAVDHLVAVLSRHISSLSTVSSLSSLLTQLSYASKAFSRYGLEFAPLVVPLFIQQTSKIVINIWEEGLAGFLKSLQILGYGDCITTPKYPTSPSKSDTIFSFETNRKFLLSTSTPDSQNVHSNPSSSFSPSSTTTPLPASQQKFSCPPAPSTSFSHVARLINSQIQGLNELRRLPALQAFPTLDAAQHRILAQVETITQSAMKMANEDEHKNLDVSKWGEDLLQGIAWSRFAFLALFRDPRAIRNLEQTKEKQFSEKDESENIAGLSEKEKEKTEDGSELNLENDDSALEEGHEAPEEAPEAQVVHANSSS